MEPTVVPVERNARRTYLWYLWKEMHVGAYLWYLWRGMHVGLTCCTCGGEYLWNLPVVPVEGNAHGAYLGYLWRGMHCLEGDEEEERDRDVVVEDDAGGSVRQHTGGVSALRVIVHHLPHSAGRDRNTVTQLARIQSPFCGERP